MEETNEKTNKQHTFLPRFESLNLNASQPWIANVIWFPQGSQRSLNSSSKIVNNFQEGKWFLNNITYDTKIINDINNIQYHTPRPIIYLPFSPTFQPKYPRVWGMCPSPDWDLCTSAAICRESSIKSRFFGGYKLYNKRESPAKVDQK